MRILPFFPILGIDFGHFLQVNDLINMFKQYALGICTNWTFEKYLTWTASEFQYLRRPLN